MILEILTPDKIIYEGKVQSVIVPGTSGAFQILKDHAPIISTLAQGDIKIDDNTSERTKNIRIKGGVVEVIQNKVSILADGIMEKKIAE